MSAVLRSPGEDTGEDTGEDRSEGRRGQDAGRAVKGTDQGEERTAAASSSASASVALGLPRDRRLAAALRFYQDVASGAFFRSQPSLPSPIPQEKKSFFRVWRILKNHRVHTIRSLVASLQDGPCTDSSFSAWNPQRLQRARIMAECELVLIYLRWWWLVPNEAVYCCPLCNIWLNIGQRTRHRNGILHRRKQTRFRWRNLTASLLARRKDII